MNPNKSLIFTGLPASGKSKIGKIIAGQLNYTFIDLDKHIVNMVKLPISKIFEKHGENKFREYEEISLREILNNRAAGRQLISLGGGAICNGKNLELCLNKGFLVWLNVGLNLLYNRLVNSNLNRRPLLKNGNLKDTLTTLYQQRVNFYNKSHLIINITRQTTALKDAEYIIKQLTATKKLHG